MKIAILALIAIVVLGGGAGGAYFYFNQKAEASVGAEGEHAAAKDVKKEHNPEHMAFVQMDPLVLPIIDADGISQMVSLVIVLQVGDEKQKASVEGQMFRIKDAYIQDMYGSLNKHVAVKDGVLQVDILKKKLSAANDRVLGEGVVSDVLLQVVQQRRI
ncbi:MAG TPA: flagellar basal body-associated FliL family protein [Micavibrio sp.]